MFLKDNKLNYDDLVNNKFYDTLLTDQQTQTKAVSVLVSNNRALSLRNIFVTEKYQCGPGNDADDIETCSKIKENYVGSSNGNILSIDRVMLPVEYADPTASPTKAPSSGPITTPSTSPTTTTITDTWAASEEPTAQATSDSPSASPSEEPTAQATSDSPSEEPTAQATSASPSASPSEEPTAQATSASPSASP